MDAFALGGRCSAARILWQIYEKNRMENMPVELIALTPAEYADLQSDPRSLFWLRRREDGTKTFGGIPIKVA